MPKLAILYKDLSRQKVVRWSHPVTGKSDTFLCCKWASTLLYIVLHHTHAVTASLLLGLHCTSSDPLLARNFGPFPSRSHPPTLTLDLDCSSTKFQTPSKALCGHNVALRGLASVSLDVFLPSLPCTLWPRKRLLIRYYPCPSLQNITSKFFLTAALLQKIDLLIFIRCVSSKCPSSLILYLFVGQPTTQIKF